MNRSSVGLCMAALALAPSPVASQASGTEPLTDQAVDAVLRFFDYDPTVPLHATTVATTQALGQVREKVVFTGATGDRVPAFLSLPDGQGPFPVVLLMHAGSSSKEAFWSASSYERGADLTQDLLRSGYAVFALDAQNHGERSANIDYVPIPTLYFENEWWASFRRMVIETAADYRRGLDYLRSREDIDADRVAALGQSMGSLTAYYVSAVEPAVSVVAAGAPALSPDWLYPITPLNLSSVLRQKSVLLVAATDDVLVPTEWTEQLFSALRDGDHELHILEGGHQLPDGYRRLMADWIRAKLR